MELNTPIALVPRNAEAAGSNPAGTIFKVERSNIFNSFWLSIKTGGFDSRAGEHQCLAGRIKNNLPDNIITTKLPLIPHGLVVRIRAFHARGQGSIPCGGVYKDAHSKPIKQLLDF